MLLRNLNLLVYNNFHENETTYYVIRIITPQQSSITSVLVLQSAAESEFMQEDSNIYFYCMRNRFRSH